MIFKEYGQENKEVIILLHGGGLSWWNYREVAELLQNDYHVVLPILNGHAGSDKDFVSIEENAEDIIAFIDEKFDGSVLAIGGLSLGAQIVAEILSKRKNICRYAIIESVLVIPMKVTHVLVKPMMDMSFGLIEKKWFAKMQFKSLKMKTELFDDYYKDTCQITKENMITFLKANSNYILKEDIANTGAKVSILVGEKESKKMRVSAQRIYDAIPGSSLVALKGKYHGEYSLNCAEEYVDNLINLL
jgi:pimeloyl-ACP methyl ester carboxylesterase